MAIRRRNFTPIKKDVSQDIPSCTKCPSCKGYNLRHIQKRKDNGIIGPGFASWVTDSYYSCADCGTRFDLVKPE